MAEILNEFLGNTLIASDWCVIKQASPTTAFLGAVSLEAYSDTAGAYEGAANSTKTIVMFKSKLATGKVWQCPFLHNGGLLQINATLTTGGFNTALGATARLRFITAPYSLVGRTWNTFISSPPTLYGTPLLLQSAQADVLETSWHFVAGLCPPAIISDGTFPDIYGFVLDCRVVFGAGYVVSSSTCQLSGVPPTGLVHPNIYAFPMP